jgi:hypothetical protein
MVRKWSYLDFHKPNSNFEAISQTASFYSFKVFRKTTRFKRFNKGLTRMVRRTYARRKHQTNHIALSFIAKYWTTHYLQARQFERFYSALGRFQTSAFSAHADVFHIRLSELSNLEGINVVSCSRPILNKHLNYSSGAGFLTNPTKFTNPTMVQVLKPAALAKSTEIYANVINFDNSLYCYDSVNATLDNSDYINELNSNLNSMILTHSIQIITPIYCVLIQLTLLNTH